MKTKLTTLLAAVAGFVATSESMAQDYTLTLDTTFASEYVFRGQKLAENTLHPSIELGVENLYAGIWAANPTEKRGSKGYGDEYDFYAGYEWALDDTTSLDVGATWYYYPAGGDTIEGYLGVSKDVDLGTVSFYAYRDFDLKTWTFEGAFGHSIALDNNASLDFSANLGTVSASGVNGNDYSYYGASVTYVLTLKESAIWSTGIHYSAHDEAEAVLGDDSSVYFTTGISIGF